MQKDKVYINLGRIAGKHCGYFLEKGKVLKRSSANGMSNVLKMGLWTLFG